MNKLPNQIKIVFTEEDRQKADSFDSCTSCIVATALKRMGYTEIGADPLTVFIGNVVYRSEPRSGLLFTCAMDNGGFNPGFHGPHYAPEVVGKELLLTKV